jgi:hypothetical protein
MLTVLLDSAAQGQRRPRIADAIDLLTNGLRIRLRQMKPRSRGSVTVTIRAVTWLRDGGRV